MEATMRYVCHTVERREFRSKKTEPGQAPTVFTRWQTALTVLDPVTKQSASFRMLSEVEPPRVECDMGASIVVLFKPQRGQWEDSFVPSGWRAADVGAAGKGGVKA